MFLAIVAVLENSYIFIVYLGGGGGCVCFFGCNKEDRKKIWNASQNLVCRGDYRGFQ